MGSGRPLRVSTVGVTLRHHDSSCEWRMRPTISPVAPTAPRARATASTTGKELPRIFLTSGTFETNRPAPSNFRNLQVKDGRDRSRTGEIRASTVYGDARAVVVKVGFDGGVRTGGRAGDAGPRPDRAVAGVPRRVHR